MGDATFPILLLPGLDGTGLLFEQFAIELSGFVAPIVVRYPFEPRMTYADYADCIALADGPFGVVAESFSGPIGIAIAARYPERVRSLVLAASFVRRPARTLLTIAANLPAAAFAVPPPSAVIRTFMLDRTSSDADVAALRSALAQVPAAVTRSRIRLLASLDAVPQLKQVRAPMLYLRATRDRLVHPKAFETIVSVRRDIEVEDVDAPHLLLQHATKRCAELASRFVLSHARCS